MVEIIVARSLNRVIGNNNALPWDCPEDLEHFKKLTRFNNVIMGSNTFHSFTKGPLKYRVNIVLSSNPNGIDEGRIDEHTMVVRSNGIAQAIGWCKKLNSNRIFVIGGTDVYRQALPFAMFIHETIINEEVVGDRYLPYVSPSDWEIMNEEMLSEKAMYLRWRRRQLISDQRPFQQYITMPGIRHE